MSDKQQFLEEARRRIENIRLDQDVQFTMLDEKIKEEDDCWYIPIRPTIEPNKTSQYYESLAAIEEQLVKEFGINVLFIPSPPVISTPPETVMAMPYQIDEEKEN